MEDAAPDAEPEAEPEAAADDGEAHEADEAGDDADDNGDSGGGGGGGGGGDGGDGGDEEHEEAASATTPSAVKTSASASASPAPVMMIRRKRLGRPPKNRPPDWDGMVEVPMSESDIAAAAAAAAAKDTPRRRGRGGWRGRGGRKGQPAAVLQQPVDKDGNLMDIVDDEVDLPPDAEGETKVDKDGNLLGGREYRCRTFTVAGRGTRLYMLSTEPARCVGFRDSYLFFTKHKRLYKIIVDDEEKRDMIERDIIPHSYKGRAIGIVTARSVFREFGALIVVGGRRVVDDYDMAKAREEGWVEGELADPADVVVPGVPYNKNQYVAWHGASAVYHAATGGGAGTSGMAGAGGGSFGYGVNDPLLGGGGAGGKGGDSKKRRGGPGGAGGAGGVLTDVNWQLEHAREASSFNSMLTAARQTTLAGVYDIHTNVMQYPASMQPRRARAVAVNDNDDDEDETDQKGQGLFTALPPQVARNFYVADLVLETPAAGIAPAAYDRFEEVGESGDMLAPFQGLGAVSDDVRALLPAECRAAFDAAAGRERAWLGQWGSEAEAMCRREPVIDKAIVPYAVTL